MRLLFDARAQLGGIGRQVHWLRRGLQDRLRPEERVFYDGSDASGGLKSFAGRSPVRAPLGALKRVAVDQLALPRIAEKSGADLFHSPNYLVPHRLAIPAVVDCYDLTLLDQFQTKKRGPMKHYERQVLLSALERARVVITPSDEVRREILRRFRLPEDRVETIYPAFQGWPPLADERLLPALTASPFFLSVGTLEPRKNLEVLLDAHLQAWKETGIPLVLVGPYGWRQRRVLDRVHRSRNRIHWLGWVRDEVLGVLYQRATACVQISLAEGFDLPAQEALAAGCPLVLSDLPVHREVGGESALYSPANDAAQVAAQLCRIAGWDEARRKRAEVQAQRQAAQLAQRSGIDRYLGAYRRALQL